MDKLFIRFSIPALAAPECLREGLGRGRREGQRGGGEGGTEGRGGMEREGGRVKGNGEKVYSTNNYNQL